MKRMLFNATYVEELRVATVEGEKLIDFDIETSSKTQRRGNIYKGVVTRVEPSLEACFVDYGTEKQGFLPFKEIDSSYLGQLTSRQELNKLPEGTELIVQVEKDERGNKGAALTTNISLPGRYLVLMPSSSRSGGISRRIDGDERDELKEALANLEVPEGMSMIARTAALGRVPEELQWDLSYLVKLWQAIKTASSSHKGSFLIYQESNLVVRSIRDHFSPDITEILIDTQEIYQQARQFINHIMPTFTERVKLYSDDVPLFSRFQIEHQIETAYSRVVHLPSGGSVVIDRTEALTAIDVNSARANKGSDIEATALATNLEAAEEIAKQLRLRDLGGLIVVDFIDMEILKSQRDVENFFRQQLAVDRARVQMGKLSSFGLLELSRQRVQASLEESSAVTCPRCDGMGTIRGIESTAVHVLRLVVEEAVKNANLISAIHVQLPVAIATYLLNEKRNDVATVEVRTKVKILLIPNVHLESPHYKIRKINSNSNQSNKVSYHLADNSTETNEYRENMLKSNSTIANDAMVKHISHVQHPQNALYPNTFKYLWKKVTHFLFGSGSVSTPTAEKPRRRSVTNSKTNGSNGGDSGRNSYTTTANRRNNSYNSNRGYTNNRNNRRTMNEKSSYNNNRSGTAANTESVPNKSQLEIPFSEANVAAAANVPLEKNENISKTSSARINTITQPVDLGELQLINTSTSTQHRHLEVEIPNKNQHQRYNDRVTAHETKPRDINYQQVETANR